MRVENYNLRMNGHRVRVATKVIFDDGTEMAFLEKMSKREAIRQAFLQVKQPAACTCDRPELQCPEHD